MSELRAYTPAEIWDLIKSYKDPQKGKLNGSKVNKLLTSADSASLYAFIHSGKFGKAAERAAAIWLKRENLAHIAHKEAQFLITGAYDPQSMSPVVLSELDNDSPFAHWISWQGGYRDHYRERHKLTLKPQNTASYEILEPATADKPASPEIAKTAPLAHLRTPFHVRLAPMMGRAAIVLNHLSPDWCEVAAFRVWAIATHIATWRDGTGEGTKAHNYVTKAELRRFLKAAGMYTRENFNRWIAEALTAGYFRSVTKTSIYFASKTAVAEMLITCLPDDVLPDFVGNQQIGDREVWVDVRGGIAKFKGQLLGAWLADRERDDSGVMISNAALADMWHVSIRTVQNWRVQARIPAVRNRDDYQQPMVNSYSAPEDTQKHNKTGQGRKIRRLVNREMTLRGFSPDSMVDVGEAKLSKRYYTQRRKQTARDRMNAAIAKYGNTHNRYAYQMYDGRYGVWERGQ